LVRQVAGSHHVVFGFAIRELGLAGYRATSCRIWLCGTSIWLGRLLGHVMPYLAVRYVCLVRQVAGSRHVVFGFAIRELGLAGYRATSCDIYLCGTCCWLGSLLGHVIPYLAVRYGSLVRQVAGPRRVVFGCVVRRALSLQISPKILCTINS
jgi:hypothetical protein